MTTAADQRTGPRWQPGVLGVPGAGGKVTCLLCPHACVLAEGQVGACGVRRNRGGVLETSTHAVTVVHLTNIERKPFYHVRPGSRVLTIAGPGCTFRCRYCINYSLSQYGQDDEVPWRAQAADPAEIVRRAVEEDAGIGMSYTEPGLAIELAVDIARLAEPAGVKLLWKSNGFLTRKAVKHIAGHLHAVNIDVKAADEEAHQRLTGAGLAPVLRAIELLRDAGVWVEVSTPLVPGTASEPGQLARIASTLAAIDPAMPWHLVRFTPEYRMRDCAPTAPRLLEEGRRIGFTAGLRYVYVERALGEQGRATCCPACGTTVVARGVWSTHSVLLDDEGHCPGCAHPIPGRWK
ncbi:AmmeMemoRadiSam system radical SAM enzyme [Amycolatopsis sp. NPDC048633]|uniref:AmmeMemoRadiSam system radical SAM enzyme n=1 Tax=Amycolatopsis sp. NPDC048633 TaxID=3157095 RepID=UPI0033DD6AE7